MPFVRVGYLEQQYTEQELPGISRCIMNALIEHFQVPPKDYFQAFHAHKQSEFYYSSDYLNIFRTDKLLYIQITMGSGRTTEQKKSFYQRLAALISIKCKIRPEDVFVTLVETELEDWSFGNGLAQMIL
ncbi:MULTISPECIES: tautomerase family protein [Paenibacillus]|uniref:tautomerase family protein n=1 Tax=Paenibacillus TaxID=44249 RepID=UPI000D303015|nr:MULTISPECIES: tautomerase family protein [Paenibacillus]MDP9676684.1 phenylpyruvate tautomerase PptA (4-oxalocrotonate tautomerase family) [Paenibacillus jamilae]KAF6619113.1 tautomerase family protein [Paenibacillus sp. EKM101P]KAF6624204.1 tautomerase family protein [Paenibacillus sp. EKM102P]KAF6636021.1 tautomerase family protein [Paenibacillus sp. EKM10P]KAF6648275.1 tautomerase family protein [Paenibacillus sp. EKM11P]